MTQNNDAPLHIKTTETFVRLYVLLSQYLDRCRDEAARNSFPESEFQAHLAETRAEAAELFSTNRVVKEKIEHEYERVLNLGVAYIEGPEDKGTETQLKNEKEILRIKTLALSDLLAVFRASA